MGYLVIPAILLSLIALAFAAVRAFRFVQGWRLAERLERERRDEELALLANPKPPEPDPRIPWALTTDPDMVTKRIYEWIDAVRTCGLRWQGLTFDEYEQQCRHIDAKVVFDDAHKETLGTVVRATCENCGATAIALMDDWLDNRYKLSREVGHCTTGVDKQVCGCYRCDYSRRPASQQSGGGYDGDYDS